MLENECGHYTKIFCNFLPEHMKALAFCTPASFRDPESDEMWHPIFYKKRPLELFFYHIIGCSRAILSGFKKFVLGKFGSSKLVVCDGATHLSFGNEVVCRIEPGGKIFTEYLSEDDRKNTHWMIVSGAGRLDSVSRLHVLSLLYQFVLAWIKASNHTRKSSTSSLVSLQVFRWILSLRWVVQWTWWCAIENAIGITHPEKIFCVHESHPLSRIVWYVSKKKNIKTIAVQHAIISREKLWYFSTKAEKEAGLCFPDVYYVYSNSDRDLLLPYLPATTKIEIACGPRYTKWKMHIGRWSTAVGGQKILLFVPSLAWWDNLTVLEGVRKCVELNERSYLIVVRLHPNGSVALKQRLRLWRWVGSEKIRLSSANIYDDLLAASVIVGATSSVLTEAALLGCPSISLGNSNFSYSPVYADRTVNISDFTLGDIDQVMKKEQKTSDVVQFHAKLLGMNEPAFRLRDTIQ